uniref:Uncharacterized protein n=1 Tax=Anguilla anguilla TaxID=7936 RepID=A0A0E9S3V9_ANGAN
MLFGFVMWFPQQWSEYLSYFERFGDCGWLALLL